MHFINMVLMALPAITVIALPVAFAIALWNWLREGADDGHHQPHA